MKLYNDHWPAEKVEKILKKDEFTDYPGPMTGEDVLNACYTGDIYISPFNRKNLTSVGYNLRASDIIVSTKNGLPLKIFTEGKSRYVVIAPHDTVLIATCESVYVSEKIMGTFHSRVMLVSQGFGHISTTLDPLWKGPLLIAFSNPSDKKKKFIVEDDGKRSAFATLIFYRLEHPAHIPHDNPPARTDVLSKFLQTPKGLKKLIVGRASEQYCQLVEKIKKSYNTYPDPLPEANPVINRIMTLLTDIHAQILDNGQLREGQAYAELNRLLLEQESVPDLNPLIFDLIAITAITIEEFDPTATGGESTLPAEEYRDLFLDFLDSFICQLRYEEQTQAWLATYEECRRIAQSDAFSANWLRLVLGRPWKRLIASCLGIIFLVAVLVVLVYTKCKDNTFWAKTGDALWAPLIGLIFTAITLLLQSLFKSRNE